MNDWHFQKNRTVKTSSPFLASDRRGRKIPKEVFKLNLEARTNNNALFSNLPSQQEVMDRFFGHQHVMNEEQRLAFINSLDDIRGDFIRSIQLQYLPSNLHYGNHEDTIPF